ncbi:MAG: serine acetyltransferase [Deltaproteobacteria bacterium]|nr:serine acetyltransferase [Deltaproteobacteria bacterium]
MRGSRAVSATLPDWRRERCGRFWDPGRRLLRAVRSYQRCKTRNFPFKSLRKYWVLEHRFWSIVAGADIPLDSDLGGGLQLPHPNGVVIFPGAVIGPNCLISQQVTIGVGGPKPGAPVIGGHVDIGAGAKILGGVKIGDHARIGANAVVLEDVPGGATAAGVPARIVRSRNPILSQDKNAETESDAYGSSVMHDTTDQPPC